MLPFVVRGHTVRSDGGSTDIHDQTSVALEVSRWDRPKNSVYLP